MPMCVPLCLQCSCVSTVCCLVTLGQHVNFTVGKQSYKPRVTPSPCQCTKVAQPQPWSLTAGWQQSEHKCQVFLPSHAQPNTSSGIHLKSALRPGSVQRHQNDSSSKERKPRWDILTSLSRTVRPVLSSWCRRLQPRDPTSRCGTF